jgi:putative hemolysin
VAGCLHRQLGVSTPVNSTILNISLVAFFILLGGVFAAAEIALVSLREGQIKTLAKRGKRGRAVARLAEDPNRFLSAVQIGVTLSGFLSAAFGAATIADDLAPLLVDVGIPDGGADLIALVAITLTIAYFSIVLSELTAKRIALQRSVGVALAFGPAIDRMARLATPIIWLLSKSTDVAVRVLGGDPGAARERMSGEELRHLVSSHETLSDEERQIVEDVFSAGDRQIREVMIPRTEVDFMDASMPVFKAVKFAADQPHSRYPVIRSSADDVVGSIHIRDLFDPEINGRSLRVGDLARDTLLIPGTREVLAALTDMRREGVHLAIVADEYGGTDGIVTLEDLVEELVGDIRDEYDPDEAHALRLVSGDVEVDGLLNLDDFRDATGLELPEGPYETVAGYIVARLGHVPQVGEECAIDGHVLTVVGVDGRRVSRVRVSRRPDMTLRSDDPSTEAG